MSPKEMVEFFKDEPVSFNPGEKFQYNNSGYVLLGYLIELISGKSYEKFIQTNIFDKVSMRNSYYASDRTVIKNRAYGYHEKSKGFVNKTSISFSIPFSSGALMSTIGDMLKWQNALNDNILLKPENLLKAFQKTTLNNGQKIDYGYGWYLKNNKDILTREHGGSIFGYKSMGIYIPTVDIYILGLSNCDCHSPTQIIKDIAELMKVTLIE
ncbi:serine hydrolase [Tenacibaculum sp. SG-28]|uniref:serine hydrolase domain-containing protein n=1 Tax=Tenacibaculum sp. SG-28 TaxID=754426 RepID=UPI002100FB7B|nr:serine hydrolase domain-containing protein [Tenacibaculum sp. SG-28]